MKIRKYPYYQWVYMLGAVLTLINGIKLHNVSVSICSLVMLYGILLYKSIHILRCYKRTGSVHPSMRRREFTKTYGLFRLRVALFWLAFIVLCLLGKLMFKINHHYFYGCTFFFLCLDRWFVNGICLLQKFSDPRGKTVICCCSCPCRGWDLMMIHTPLLFALEPQWSLENGMIILSSTLGLISLICWESNKFHLMDVRPKCPTSCDLKLCRERLKSR